MYMTAAAAAVMLMPCSVAMAAAEPESPEGPTPAAERQAPVCTTSAVAVAEATQRVCGSAPIDEALLSVRLQPEVAEDVGWMLAGLGFRQALDLQLLAGGPEPGGGGAPGRAEGGGTAHTRR